MECPLLNFNDELIPTGTGSFRFREMKCRKKVQKNLSLGTKLIVCQGFGSVFFLYGAGFSLKSDYEPEFYFILQLMIFLKRKMVHWKEKHLSYDFRL